MPSRSSSTDADRAEQRAAAKRAAAQRAAARKRRDQLGVAAVALAGVLAVGLIVGVALYLMNRDKPVDTASPQSSAPASAPAEAPAEQPEENFPPVPEGADPALKTEPKVGKGSGAPPTKLVVTKLIEGKGAAVKSGQTIKVNYTGVSFATGEQFDSSWKRKQSAAFPIGVGQVIPGWDKGLVGVTIGSRIQLDIPSSLAYGDNPQQGPKGALRFVVDVLGAQ